MRPARLVSNARRAAQRLLVPDHDQQWARVVMDRSIDEHLGAMEPARRRALEVSGEAHRARGWATYDSWTFPAFDVCAPLPADHERFDVVIAEQVLEHVVDPLGGLVNLRKLATPGGWVVVSTPFLLRLHHEPIDYWRFTPDGLRHLAARAGLEVDTVGHWGNRRCIKANFDGWALRRRWSSLEDEPDLPVVVWLVARAPGGEPPA